VQRFREFERGIGTGQRFQSKSTPLAHAPAERADHVPSSWLSASARYALPAAALSFKMFNRNLGEIAGAIRALPPGAFVRYLAL